MFLKLRRLLGLHLPVIDPSIYIDRYAEMLDVGDKESDVAATALRVVASMKRDWLTTGRRPTGIVAAALLVASRAHGIYRSQREVRKLCCWGIGRLFLLYMYFE